MTYAPAPSSGCPLRVGAVLSLTGQFARFGTQAARALTLWSEWDGAVRPQIVDDGGNPEQAAAATRELGRRVDLLLGPYSTVLANAAAKAARDGDLLLWNHGGSGTHVERGFPGHVVSVLTPTSGYAEPFVTELARGQRSVELWIAEGSGRFARQVARGAAERCEQVGVRYRRVKSDELREGSTPRGPWSLFSAGSFEEDTAVANWATNHASPPVRLCAVGAGVHEFGQVVCQHDGVFGVAQWVAGRNGATDLGPAEPAFLRAYEERWDQALDYPGIQAVAAATIATHCARTAGDTARGALWSVAVGVRATTMFGRFEIDPESGEQRAHRMALVRWVGDLLLIAA